MSDRDGGSTAGIEIPGSREGYQDDAVLTRRGSGTYDLPGGPSTPPNTPLSTSLNPNLSSNNNSSIMSKSWFAEQLQSQMMMSTTHRSASSQLGHAETLERTPATTTATMATAATTTTTTTTAAGVTTATTKAAAAAAAAGGGGKRSSADLERL